MVFPWCLQAVGFWHLRCYFYVLPWCVSQKNGPCLFLLIFGWKIGPQQVVEVNLHDNYSLPFDHFVTGKITKKKHRQGGMMHFGKRKYTVYQNLYWWDQISEKFLGKNILSPSHPGGPRVMPRLEAAVRPLAGKKNQQKLPILRVKRKARIEFACIANIPLLIN